MDRIVKADRADLEEILSLQYLAYQSEAALFGNTDIPPLKQTIDEVADEYEQGLILKLTDENGNIIGSIRAKEAEGTVYIGKLMVHPDHRCKGYGSKLLAEIEHCFPGKRYELFTSTRSEDNIRLYQKNGYREFDRRAVRGDLIFVYMENLKKLFEVKECPDLEIVKGLFTEYSHIQGAESCFVSFDKELNDLSGFYKGGAILVGYEDVEPVACIALKKIDDEVCEAKRLYIKPENRGNGYARIMLNVMLNKAGELGFKELTFTTKPSVMEIGYELYKRMGFEEVSEKDGIVSMRMELDKKKVEKK